MRVRTPADVMAAYFNAWKTGELADVEPLFAEDVDFAGPLGQAHGPAECAGGLRRLAQITDDLIIKKVFADGDDVLTWFELRTHGAPPAQVANWSRVEDGRIKRIRVTFDPRDLLSAKPG
jgi:ketosteroid isomerase-like protein